MQRATSASLPITRNMCALDVSPSHRLGDPPVPVAHSDAEVSSTTFSVEGDSRGGGLVPAINFPAREQRLFALSCRLEKASGD